MNTRAWCLRLSAQLPGWHVWRQSGGVGGSGWCALPAPVEMTLREAVHEARLPGRVGPYRKPQELRAVARERYGWNDYCGSCGVLARECGHRMPEAKVGA